MRCVHLNRVGDQCQDQALNGRQLCAFHARMLEDYDPDGNVEAASASRTESRSRFPMIYRLAALILLILLLFQTFGSIRTWLDF